MSVGFPLRAAGPSGVVNFIQGALGGGGFADGLSGPATTTHIFVRGNYPDLYRWKATSGTCDNVTTSPFMDRLGISPATVGTPLCSAVAPSDETRVYLITGNMPPRLGYQAFAADYGQLFISNDGGASWDKAGSSHPSTDALTQPFGLYNGNIYSGSNLVVDPLNKDIVWFMDWSGAVYVTYNAGTSWTLQSTLMDLALPKATAAGNVSADGTCGQNTFKVTSNPILGNTYDQYGIGIFNATHPFTINGSGTLYADASSSSTLIAFAGRVQSRTGAASVGGDPGVANSDVIYFGRSGGICIDSSLGSIPNPGGSGVMSKLVYFGWHAGASSMYKTEDAGSTFSAMFGSPSAIDHKMKLSNDATLGGGGNNVLYLYSDAAQKYYRWVRTHPTGSSLADNTWTSYDNSVIHPVGNGEGWLIIPDPATQGRVLFIRQPVTPNVSLDYGDTRIGYTDGRANINGDTRWMDGTPGLDLGDAEFSKATPHRLFYALGTGFYYCDVTDTSATQTITAQMQTLQSLIVGELVKVPAPADKIVLGFCQDRSFVVIDNVNTIPDGYYPAGVNQSSGRACYSLDDPTKIFIAEGFDLYQYAGGNTSGIQNFTQITTNGAHGWTNAFGCSLESRSSTELCAISGGVNIRYGTLSGGVWSWTDTLFGGSPIVGVTDGKFGGASKNVDIDWVSGIIWYADITAGTLYKSVDGGATLTRPGAAGAGAGFFQFPGQGAQLRAVPGQTDHLFFAQGYGGDGSVTFFPNPGQTNLSFTNDGGANWHHVAGTYIIMFCAVGPAKPGSSYPTVYIFGQLDPVNTFQYSLYRCTDWNPITFTGTWVDIGANLKKIECSNFRGGITADPDNWSNIFLASSDNGYVKGFLP